ncbi:hypothetical protein PFISCL1PPCAC_6499 [Pristionchus fissidentatus]|uniref:ER membrane protein complex subunit 2 n=1 Tax=Pristionchus fissidentatus TaxID=1538716 RepID=A0AAV5V6H0_9BILA|nr:hypothetical protein PFISCL1PPCAC_6499 [Pristionchus fissidentatus]
MVADRRDWTTASFEEGREALKEWRDEHARRSEEVVELWEHVLSRSPSSLADELCTVYEQVCISALDCARTDLAHECINALHKRFPGSARVLRLQAMFYEARSQWKTAEGIYEKLIAADETNTAYRKRRIAMLIGQGKRLESIKALNEHLESFITDSEAWLQLSELYLAESDYARAAHAMEEVLLAAPTNSIYLRRLADIRYTQGGQEHLDIARAYYEQALKFSPQDLRALYGVVLSCNTLLATGRITGDKKKEYTATAASALQRIVERYESIEPDAINPEENSNIIEAVRSMEV